MAAEELRLEPRYHIASVTPTVLIDDGISVVRDTGFEIVEGQVVFDWHAGFRVELSGEDALAQFRSGDPLTVRLPDERWITVNALWSRRTLPNGGWQVRGSAESTLHGDPAALIVELLFHATNWPHAHFGTDGHPDFRTVIEAGPWELTLDRVGDYEEIAREARLRRSGATTHMGRIRQTDGRAFTWTEVQHALEALRFVMSFAAGHHVAPMFATGLDGQGKVAVEEWGDYKRDPMAGVIAWSSAFIRRNALGDLWPIALDHWQYPRVRRMLNVALGMYLDAQTGRNLETRLVSAQAGLELLAWEQLTQPPEGLDPEKVDKKPAPWRLRKLLGRMAVDATVPTTLTETRGQLPGHDGPQAVSTIRNGVVHPKGLDREGDGVLTFEILRLATWYLELAILHHLGYQGKHLNRTQQLPLFEGSGDNVPWAKSKEA